MSPRPLTRRLLALFSLIAMLVVSQAGATFASGRHSVPGGIDVNGGDPATDPNPAASMAAASDGAGQSGTFSDVPAGFWDRSSIDYVAGTQRWMRDYGTSTFRPATLETRELFAKAVVSAFDPSGSTDPHLKFGDVNPRDPNAPYINVAVKNGWMVADGDDFHPTDPVTTLVVHRALIWALGLSDVVAGANKIHTTDGYVFKHGPTFGTRLIGAVLGLRYDHSENVALNVGPSSKLNRAEVAYSLYRAYVIDTSQTWEKNSVQIYKTIHLGPVPVAFRPVVEYGMRFVGYPYIYAGEWYMKSPPGYCCGSQPRGGFDCSGLMWWVLRAGDSLYNAARYHPAYKGYVLNERSSNDMSHAISKTARVPFDKAKAGNLLFYDSNHDGTIDHVDLFLGWGWALDSGSNGVTITRVADPGSWYQDSFAWGRVLAAAK
ncbi:MAG TPA: NlpC/P60 family protein [Actinomycetota bacterium]|jgi:cell wall-associated NlpC family hydrolase